ncbi:MAG: adenylate/guanylate cyclase domain-containing protein, partial [Candidatus Promineifilaceae bacterium]
MKWLGKIEQRVTLPGDSETQRSQKTLVVVVALFGFVATLFNALPMFNGGLSAMGWTYVGSAVCILAGALLILAWPRHFTLITFLLLLDVLIFPAITQVLSGGYASGMFFMVWPVLAPLGAVLVLGTRHTLIHFFLFMLTVVVIAALEPFSLTIAPEITSSVRLGYNIPGLISFGLIIAAASLYLLRQVERFRQRVDALLLDILPASIAARLKLGAQTIADGFDSVTVLFADIVDFTQLSADADPVDVVRLLNAIFSDFDDLAARHGLEKIKTVGDAYMVAAGLPRPRPDHVEAVAAFALDMLDVIGQHQGLHGEPVRLRIGINTGPVVAGVIGHQKFSY